MASCDAVDIIVALDKESIELHERELSGDGLIIYDSSALKQKYEKENFLDVPFVELAMSGGGSKIMANTVATGVVLGMLGLKLDILDGIISETFQKKGQDVIRQNVAAAKAGQDFAVRECRKCAFQAAQTGDPLMMVAGIEAIALGAIASGCRFYAAYPMTPSTGIMNYLAGKEAEYGIIVEQAEDEIAAINLALGASYGGVRAMTGTAGGGFALMSEGLSLAGMTETPIVIALGQRPAPATGLPTRTEQGDLLFALHTAHGEFPRVILAPGSPEEAFHLTNKAFELAEKYQVPAIVIFDQYLADSTWTCSGFDMKKIVYTDYRIRGEAFEEMTDYKRHAFTETGISPLGVPGESKNVVVTDSDEHSEEGHIIEDAETRVKMMEKRLFRKMPLIRKEIEQPRLYGSSDGEIVVAGWGSTFGVIKEVVESLAGEASISFLHFSQLYPFPEDNSFMRIMESAKMSICVENNATGQFARLVRMETGFDFTRKINKFDGRPFTFGELRGEIRAHIAGL
jgi:2-oxoglutarate/2-oxoacid ferredoxin oxidoreductase subunit alpha